MTEVGLRLDLLVGGGVSLALIALTVFLWLMYRSVNKKSYWRGDGWFGPAAVFSFVAAGALIVMSIAMIPYSTEYYYLYRVSGNVESVTNKMVESSGEFSQHTVLTLDTVDRPVEMSDPRGVTLQGKDVDLTCSISWHYMAQDTYHCSIYSIGGDDQ